MVEGYSVWNNNSLSYPYMTDQLANDCTCHPHSVKYFAPRMLRDRMFTLSASVATDLLFLEQTAFTPFHNAPSHHSRCYLPSLLEPSIVPNIRDAVFSVLLFASSHLWLGSIVYRSSFVIISTHMILSIFL